MTTAFGLAALLEALQGGQEKVPSISELFNLPPTFGESLNFAGLFGQELLNPAGQRQRIDGLTGSPDMLEAGLGKALNTFRLPLDAGMQGIDTALGAFGGATPAESPTPAFVPPPTEDTAGLNLATGMRPISDILSLFGGGLGTTGGLEQGAGLFRPAVQVGKQLMGDAFPFGGGLGTKLLAPVEEDPALSIAEQAQKQAQEVALRLTEQRKAATGEGEISSGIGGLRVPAESPFSQEFSTVPRLTGRGAIQEIDLSEQRKSLEEALKLFQIDESQLDPGPKLTPFPEFDQGAVDEQLAGLQEALSFPERDTSGDFLDKLGGFFGGISANVRGARGIGDVLAAAGSGALAGVTAEERRISSEDIAFNERRRKGLAQMADARLDAELLKQEFEEKRVAFENQAKIFGAENKRTSRRDLLDLARVEFDATRAIAQSESEEARFNAGLASDEADRQLRANLAEADIQQRNREIEARLYTAMVSQQRQDPFTTQLDRMDENDPRRVEAERERFTNLNAIYGNTKGLMFDIATKLVGTGTLLTEIFPKVSGKTEAQQLEDFKAINPDNWEQRLISEVANAFMLQRQQKGSLLSLFFAENQDPNVFALMSQLAALDIGETGGQ